MSKKRVNKSKREIVSDIQLAKDADRRRHLISDIIFPFLVEIDENIAYSKIFIQSFSGLVEGVYEEHRKKTTIGSLSDRLEEKIKSVFVTSDPEQKRELGRYLTFIKKLRDISVQDFSYAAELPRYIDGYIMSEKGKDKVQTISIDTILGK